MIDESQDLIETVDRVLHDMGNPQPKESKQWLREFAQNVMKARADIHQAVVAERDNFAARMLRHYDVLHRISDAVEDKGDRVYFGSTNDADDLRYISKELESYNWDRELEVKIDWQSRVNELIGERDALREQLATARKDALKEAMDAIRKEDTRRRNLAPRLNIPALADELEAVIHALMEDAS